MIEPFHFDYIKHFGPSRGLALCLGDQRLSHRLEVKHHSTCELFQFLGYDQYADIDYNGKAAINADLNHPVVPVLAEAHRCGFIFDGGVCEHVANIGQAFTTILGLCAIGGVVMQCVPMHCYGASYYGIDPQLQRDFFEANGFETLIQLGYDRQNLQMKLYHIFLRIAPPRLVDFCRRRTQGSDTVKNLIFDDDPGGIKVYRFDGRRECRFLPHTTTTMYIGRRVVIPDKVTWPHQSCYKANPP